VCVFVKCKGDPSEIYSAIGDEAELESSTSQSSEGERDIYLPNK